MPTTQARQFTSITTPLGDDVLLLQKFTGQEAISKLFNFQLELASEKSPPLIGQNVTVNMMLADGSTRYLGL
jgi:type VI secretion system secreted protein VgrG